MSDWTLAILDFGHSRNWRALPRRRALRRFCEASGLAASGLAADRAFRLGYAALAEATPEERAACRDWQAVKDLMARQTAERAERRTEEARRETERRAKKIREHLAAGGRVYVWPQGLAVEDVLLGRALSAD
jgi:hypothetical protein